MLIAATVEVYEVRIEAAGKVRGKYCAIVTDYKCYRKGIKKVFWAHCLGGGRLDTTISSILFTENDTKELQECSLFCVCDVLSVLWLQ